MDAKYDGFKMDKIIEEMKKVIIRIILLFQNF